MLCGLNPPLQVQQWHSTQNISQSPKNANPQLALQQNIEDSQQFKLKTLLK